MITVRSSIRINAPIERCFRLSVSTDLQMAATSRKAIAGVTKGLFGPGDTITWGGPGGRQEMLIEAWRPLNYFREVMVAGSFKAYEHEHHFAPMDEGTRVRDEIRFTASIGLLGPFSAAMLKRRVTRLLEKRNALLKQAAESDDWQQYLEGQPEINLRPYQSLSSETPASAPDRIFAK